MKLSVYLNFKGNTEEAAIFYAEALDAPKPRILKFSDLPPNPDYPIDEESKNLVLHTEIQVGDTTMNLSDVPPGMEFSQGNSISVVINFNSEAEIIKVYKKLSVDATAIIMPLDKTEWAEKYTYFIDKFGTPWQLNYKGSKVFGM